MPGPLLPSSTAAAAAAMLLELYGDEWLVMPAMHYRWSFPEQRERLLYQFGRCVCVWGGGMISGTPSPCCTTCRGFSHSPPPTYPIALLITSAGGGVLW
jgi:hypothetical protein